MIQEDKELLFKDLSARLPYHVRVKVWLKDGIIEEGVLDLKHNYADVLLDAFYYNKIKDVKPYLRPMTSMTEEEKNEHFGRTMTIDIVRTSKEVIDWLNAHHFDYRGLIEKRLALEAPKDMYKMEE
jgi:hypothetical protein